MRVSSHNKETRLFVCFYFLLVWGRGVTGRNLTLTSGCHSTFKLKWQLWLAVWIWIVTAGVDFVQQGGETQSEHTSINWPAAPFPKPEHWAIQSHTCGRGPHKIFFYFGLYMLIQIQNEWLIFTFWDHCGLESEKNKPFRECAMENCRKWVELGNLWRGGGLWLWRSAKWTASPFLFKGTQQIYSVRKLFRLYRQ